ncbi:hypothetical protein P5673_003002 [Acropora cervicornis]|uniref:Uncharacterized protein n=1 Tax=Acropora cervicornis TaxID=6130 RepID=A0AAD9VEL1_ACRCE|nr:hypothetical protein P5673_003002 [Acropora cervicornis]
MLKILFLKCGSFPNMSVLFQANHCWVSCSCSICSRGKMNSLCGEKDGMFAVQTNSVIYLQPLDASVLSIVKAKQNLEAFVKMFHFCVYIERETHLEASVRASSKPDYAMLLR